MRVTTLIQGFAPIVGGEQRLVQRWAPLWEREGVESVVLTRRWQPDVPIRERQPGLKLWRIPRAGLSRPGAVAWLAGGLAGTVASRPDVIQAMELLSPTTIALAARRVLGVPVVAKVLSTGPRGDVSLLKTKPLGRQRIAQAAREVDAWVCMTTLIRDELLAEGVPEDRLHLMANGVDAAHFHPASPQERADARQWLGLGPDEVVHLYCGRFREVKRLDVVLQAVATVPGHVVLVGEGPEEARLRAMAEEPALRGRVTILPPVEDTAPFYRAADVYISASHTEGMSVSVLEAMASGNTVVASPASGMIDLLGGDAGVVAADAGSDALAAVLADVVGDPARRRTHGEVARRKVEKDFSLEANASAMLDVYRSLTPAGPRP